MRCLIILITVLTLGACSTHTKIDSAELAEARLAVAAAKVAGAESCTPESEKYNMWLSQRRTKWVLNYLVSQGISAERLVGEAYGESRLLAEESQPDGEAQNRRVELSLR